MSTGREHFEEAERYLKAAVILEEQNPATEIVNQNIALVLAHAQAHATLALADYTVMRPS